MVDGRIKTRPSIGKSVSYRLPHDPFKRVETDQPKPRVRRLSVRLGRARRLVITARRYRTNPAKRSDRYKQVVLHLRLLSFREVAVAYHRKKSRRRLRLSTQTLVPASMMVIGVSGIMYFALNLRNPVTLKLVGSNTVAAAAPIEPAAVAQPKTMSRSEPTRIRIPKVGIDTSVMAIGLKADGTINMPNVFDAAGWYNGGPTPGEIGPSVIVGHVDSPHDTAVFWRLREMLPGDLIGVDRQDGTTANFRVTAVKQFPQDQFPTQEVYGNTDYAGLRVITCGGTFNAATQHYSHNTVVYANLE